MDVFGLNPKLFESLFWNTVKDAVKSTKYKVKGAKIYQIIKKLDILNVKKGDYFHIDTLHNEVEIELYDNLGNHKGALSSNANIVKDKVKGRKCK